MGKEGSKGDNIPLREVKRYDKRNKQHGGTKFERRQAQIVDAALKSAGNPVEWYKRYPNLYQAVTNMYFMTPLGQKINITGPDGGDPRRTGYTRTIPGICRLGFEPGPGYSEDNNSPMNNTLITLFTYMRNRQRITGNFQWADMGIYVLGLDSLNMVLTILKRLYGIAKRYPKMNYYYARALADACGVSQANFMELVDNYSDLRAAINIRVNQITQLAVPAGMDLWERHSWMCEGMYLDGDAEQSQTYVFMPDTLWKYNNTNGTLTQAWTPGAQPTSIKGWLNLFDTMFSAFKGDEDTGFISGAFKAVFEGRLWTTSEIGEEYEITPVYNTTVLSQIENAMFAGVPATTNAIVQDPSINQGGLIYKPQFVPLNGYGYNTNSLFTEAMLINLHVPTPGPDDIMEATRLMAAIATGDTPGFSDSVKVRYCGSEVMTTMCMYTTPGDTYNMSYAFVNLLTPNADLMPGAAVTLPINISNEDMSDINNGNLTIARLIAELSTFDWHPRVGILTGNTQYASDVEGGTFQIVSLEREPSFWDYDNFAYITRENLDQLHYTALNSLFDIPGLVH